MSSNSELYVLHTSDTQPSKLYQSQCFQTVPKVPCGIKLPQLRIKVGFFLPGCTGSSCVTFRLFIAVLGLSSCSMECGILVPGPEIKLISSAMQGSFSTSAPLRKYQRFYKIIFYYFFTLLFYWNITILQCCVSFCWTSL